MTSVANDRRPDTLTPRRGAPGAGTWPGRRWLHAGHGVQELGDDRRAVSTGPDQDDGYLVGLT